MNNTTPALLGINVLVTRPKELADNLARLIKQEGGDVFMYPVITIEDTNTPDSIKETFARLSSFDIAVFISPTAVIKTFEHISALPSTLEVAAIGSSTEQALAKRNVLVTIKPEGHTSEDLLRHEKLQAEKLNGKSIIIFRGTGGREYLGNTLVSRGARIHYAEMYKRVTPTNTASLTDGELSEINVITITSNEGLQNLFDLTNNAALLTQIPIIVPGERSKSLAKALGFNQIIQSENATDRACIKALKKWAHL